MPRWPRTLPKRLASCPGGRSQVQLSSSYFAVNLNKRGSDSVGVIVPEHSEGFFTVVMGGVEKYLLSKHYVYFYFTACHNWKP
jgi:LacI family transcriptional regulator